MLKNYTTASTLLALSLGLVSSILIPSLAIHATSSTEYSILALALGMVPIVAFSDWGTNTGLVRNLAQALAASNTTAARRLKLKVAVLILLTAPILTLIATGITYSAANQVQANTTAILTTTIGFATTLTLLAEINLISLRAEGKITASYLLKASYHLTLLAATSLSIAIFAWNQIEWMAAIYVASSALLLLTSTLAARDRSPKRIRRADSKEIATSHSKAGLDSKPSPLAPSTLWQSTWKIAGADRRNRLLQMVFAAIERPLLTYLGALPLVGSLDLLLRTSLLISAVPGAITQPLAAMIANKDLHEAEPRYAKEIEATRRATKLLTVLGFASSLTVWLFFHSILFGIESELPASMAVLILGAISTNTLTAYPAATCIANGNISRLQVKTNIEWAGILTGLALAAIFSNALLFVIARYCSLTTGATYFLVTASREHNG